MEAPMTAIPTAAPAAGRTGFPYRLLHRLVRGAERDPRWVRPALGGLLAGTALLYLVGLGASGWANAFYSAAAQAGSESWEAFLFGSSDAANAITVDKTPAFLWLMDLSVRAFGLSSWSILVPEALLGVASVAVLYLAVRRVAGPAAGLLAGAALAVTPVATLMFRYNNPDALLVLLLTAAAYATLRAAEKAGVRWLALAGALVGFGFLTKMLQAFLVLPALALAYLVAAPVRLRRRILHVLAAGAAMVVSAGWYVALVELWPASARPYVGGTQHNSILELTLGYNGFGRLTGDESGGLGNTNQDAGWLRLFGSDMGGQISWLLPAALIALAVGLWVTRRAPRTHQRRAALLVWGGWLLVTGAVISLSQGIIHPYYTVALAPAVAALVGIGAALLWRRRHDPRATTALATMVATTAVWSYVLLNRTPGWHPWLRYLVLVGGLAAAVLLVAAARLGRRALAAGALLGVLSGLAGPTGYSVATAATAHSGALPSAGPSGMAGFGGRPTGGGAPAGGGPMGGGFAGGANGRPGTMPTGGGFPGGNRAPGAGTRGGGMQGGGPGAVLDTTTPGARLVSVLSAGHSRYTWVAAVVGSNSAAGYQLATGYPAMAVGGFNGTDDYPTLAQFQKYVAAGRIHYFVAGSTSSAGGSDAAQRIATWVAKNFSSRTVSGVTVYDLTQQR
jgi:4-amino-4-deoxy-L-arabinose transferase-like glycosyltransferase